MRLVVALALALGCGKSSGPSAPDCADTAKGVDAMVARAHEQIATAQLPDDERAQAEERTKKLDALVPRLKAVIANHCVDGKWPPDVIECYANVTSMDDSRACRERLSHLQQAKLQRAELAVMTDQGGLPGLGSAVVPPTDEVAKLQAQLRVLNTSLAATAKWVEEAKTDAERDEAAAALKRTQLEMQQLNAKLDAARAKAAQPQP